MTYTLTLTPYLAAMLDAACRSTGLDTLNIFPSVLNRSGYTIPAAVLPTQHPAAATPVAPVQPTPAFIPAPPVPGLEPVDGPPDFSALTSAMHHKL